MTSPSSVAASASGSAATLARRLDLRASIPGTALFDGTLARKGFALNAMCFSFNDEANRKAFLANEDAYCAKFALTAEQRAAVAKRDVLAMIAAGGNVYYLAKLAGIFGLNVQDLGALQTGMSVEAFKAMLLAQRDRADPAMPGLAPLAGENVQ